MKLPILMFGIFVGCATIAVAAQQAWEFKYRPVVGKFVVYGGGLGDPYAPSQGNRHVAFWIEAAAAKEMFEAMGPDIRDACGAEDGGRVRIRREVSCFFRPKEGYRCAFGFDMTSGKSIGGSVC